jgi:hypothetical protein
VAFAAFLVFDQTVRQHLSDRRTSPQRSFQVRRKAAGGPCELVQLPTWRLQGMSTGAYPQIGHFSTKWRDYMPQADFSILIGRSCACDVQLCSLLLVSRQRGGQKPEFGLHFSGIGHSISDLLAKEFAIPLAKPVNRNFERTL